MEDNIKIDQFLDDKGRLISLPQKFNKRYALLVYLAKKFEPNTVYTERQVNEICDSWHTFGDFFLLRRELIDNRLLGREPDGSRYWRILAEETE